MNTTTGDDWLDAKWVINYGQCPQNDTVRFGQWTVPFAPVSRRWGWPLRPSCWWSGSTADPQSLLATVCSHASNLTGHREPTSTPDPRSARQTHTVVIFKPQKWHKLGWTGSFLDVLWDNKISNMLNVRKIFICNHLISKVSKRIKQMQPRYQLHYIKRQRWMLETLN